MKINKYVLISTIVFFSLASTLLAQQYTYKVDLQNINEDRVKVICNVPKLSVEKADFIFPNVIPGSYSLKEFGRYINDFKAYDLDGRPLKVKKADKCNFSIQGADKLQRIEYYVNDSWEEKKEKQFIFQPGGTNIDAGKNFVINNYGFFGYVEGMKSIPYHITFSKPTNLKGYSYLKINSANDTTDLVSADNYDLLADNPIMYCPPQEASLKIGNSEVNICVYSENNKVNANQVSEIIQPIARSLQKFFGALPVDRYLFMFYLADATKVPKRKGKGLSSGFGALEHNHCSFYFMPETSNMTSNKEMLTQVCSHEFLHILTPLNLHSREIEDFNFRVPVMSKHLWMYEGVTEYFSLQIRMQDSLITMKDFIKEIRDKMFASAKFDKFSMIEMSKNVVDPKNQARYLSVYSRGALLAMMLDILIIDKSAGKNSLRQVMMNLAQKYGPSKPFNDDDLLAEIESLTCPEVGTFFQNYIIGDMMPDYKSYFDLIGYDYYKMYNKETYYFGRFGLRYNDDKKEFSFTNVDLNLLGVKDKDILVSVNNTNVDMENINRIYEEFFSDNDTGKKVNLEIIRNGEKIVLEGMPKKAIKQMPNYIEPAGHPDLKAKNNLKKFMGNLL